MSTLRIRTILISSAVATWLLVAVGGFVRVSESGLGCPDWPLCSGRIVPFAEQAPIIEFSHRLTTTLVTALVVASAWVAFRHARERRDVVAFTLVAVALLPVQALLGAAVVWKETPGWLVAVHFVVGFIFFACTVAAAVRFSTTPRAVPRRLVRLAVAALVTGILLVVVGAAVVAVDAGEACGRHWPACDGSALGGSSNAWIQSTHRLLAYTLAALIITAAFVARRAGVLRRVTLLASAAVLGQATLGVAIVLSHHGTMTHDVLEVAHVAGAGAVWASVVAFAAQATIRAD